MPEEEKESALPADARARGFPGFRFASMASTIRRDWSAVAPAWRIATNGLNLEGKCNTAGCRARGQWVIVRVGFSALFDMASGRFGKVCPEVSAPSPSCVYVCVYRFMQSACMA